MGRRLQVAALAAALAIGGSAAAQDFAHDWNPRSGDAWVDRQLDDINVYGARYREPFIDEIVRYHAAPRDLVAELLSRRRWAPGDVYYACALAQIIGRPCRYVVDAWDRDHAQGWGALAKQLGVKPGSSEFHRLKRGFVPTYDRWARPIALDAELKRDYPNRGKRSADGKGKPARASGQGKNDNAGQRGNSGKAKQ